MEYMFYHIAIPIIFKKGVPYVYYTHIHTNKVKNDNAHYMEEIIWLRKGVILLLQQKKNSKCSNLVRMHKIVTLT